MMMNRLVKGALLASIIVTGISCSGGALQQNRKLANEILNDSSFQLVDSMGRSILARGLNAGSGYSQVWARDLNTFIETACEVAEQQDIRNALLIFFRLQQPNDEMIDGYVLKGEFDWDDPTPYYSDLAPEHVAFKNTVETDQETSLIQAVAKYIRKTGDTSILKERIGEYTVYERMEKMIDFLLKEKFSEKYGLLTGALTADWGDVQNDSTNIVDITENSTITIDIYDQAMFILALNGMAEMSENTESANRWSTLSKQIADSARKYLWDTERKKFIPHIYLDKSPIPEGFNELDVYYHGGTAIAIEAGLLTKEEIAAVNKQMLENVRLSGMPSIGLTLYPPYPEGFFTGGMAKPYIYQNGGDWTWFGGRMIQQLIANGYVTEAYEEVRPMIDRVIKNKGFYEWYGQGGIPSGSGHFKGSAGVLCKVIEMFNEWADKNK